VFAESDLANAVDCHFKAEAKNVYSEGNTAYTVKEAVLRNVCITLPVCVGKIKKKK